MKYLHIACVHPKWFCPTFWAEIDRRLRWMDERQQAKDIREARKAAA